MDLENGQNEQERAKLQNLIDVTEEMMQACNGKCAERYSVSSDNANTMLVAAVCAYFSLNGYLLAYELLVHAETNTVLDVICCEL